MGTTGAGASGIRMFAFDLDGTFLAPDKSVTPRARAAVDALLERGVEPVPTTGRAWQPVSRVLGMDELRYLVAGCGAIVRDLRTGEFLRRLTMPAPVAAQLVRSFTRPGTVAYACLDDEEGTRWGSCASEADYERVHSGQVYWDDHPEPFDVAAEIERRGVSAVKVGVHYAKPWRAEDFHEVARGLGLWSASSWDSNVEVNAAGASKAGALEMLAGRLGFGMGQVCAIGDSGNDADMLRAAGLGVAMGNALPEARAAADEVLELTNAQDGLADFVERRLL